MRLNYQIPAAFCVAFALTGTPAMLRAQEAAPSAPAPAPAQLALLTNRSVEVQKLPGGALLTIDVESQLQRLPDIKLRLGSQADAQTRTYVYRLTRGRVDVSFAQGKRSQVAVLVIAPNGQSGVIYRGQGSVVANSDGYSFTALERYMLIGKGSQWRQLGPGRTVAFNHGTRVFKEVPVPSRTEVVLDNTFTFALSGSAFWTKLRLLESTGADRYRIDVLRRDGEHWLPAKPFYADSAETKVTGDQAGEYVVVARALNRFGIEGELSEPVALRVVGVELPAGASMTPNGISLAPNQHLTLSAVEGLKMTYGPGKYFVPAPSRISLGHGKPTTARLLDPSTNQELRLKLIPRIVLAQIELGPATAVWPDDEIQAQVELVDGSGNPVQDTHGFNANVSINLQPSKTAWKQQGNIMQASVKVPPGTRGPWVVRVEVKNPGGHVIGRNFLEVARR